MKKLVILLIIITICLVQTTSFAFSISDNSKNGVKIGVFENVEINEEAPGSVLTILGDAHIKGKVHGDVIVVFGNVSIDAEVSGNVISVLGTVTLLDKARISGDFISVGKVEKSGSASILGENRTIDIGNFNLDTSKISIFIIIKSISLVIFLIFVILLGFPLIAIFNKRFQNMTDDIELRLGRKLTIGFPGFIICFLTLILLSITGLIPLIYFFFSILIEIIVCIFIGKTILNLLNSKGSLYFLFIIGLLLLVVLKALFILLVYVNGFPMGIALCFGFDLVTNALGTGILIESQFGRKEF